MLIEARNLVKTFGARRAVNGVSFAVAAGSIVGLLGSNGAGKSTTMRMLTGGLAPDGGRATIAGHDVIDDAIAARAAFGYLPESAAGFFDLTVREVLIFAGEARGLRGAPSRRALARVTDLVDLGPALDRPQRALSKGWRQRAWLAQAILHDPPVLILDEPTDGLDPNQKTHLRGVLAEMGKTKAILMSTHILEEAEALCDRVIVMSDGAIVADAPRSDLVDASGRLAAAVARLTAGERERASA